MINYVNIEKKRRCNRNNGVVAPFVVDYDTKTQVDFSFINNNNQVQPLLDNASGFYFAGSLKYADVASSLLFLTKDYTISSNVITFSVDTYTVPYLEKIKKPETEIFIEIGQDNGTDVKTVFLRDQALAWPRVYVEGATPSIPSTDYYTKCEVDEKIGALTLSGLHDVTIEGTSIVTSAVAEIPFATTLSAGVVKVDVANGLVMDEHGTIAIAAATSSEIDAGISTYKPVVAANLKYAVRGVSDIITIIPAEVTTYQLLDRTAVTRDHSHVYRHSPETRPTYTLPSVTDYTITHTLSVKVIFSSDMTTAPLFLDEEGGTLTPIGDYDITETSIIEYLCEYDNIVGWAIYPLVVRP